MTPATATRAREFPTILLIDDDDEVRGVLAEVLLEEGYRTLCARSGAEAAAHARRTQPSLVLLDYRLAGEPADAVAASLRAACGSGLPIVLLSGTTELQRCAVELGVVGTLSKPFGLDDLLRCIQTHSATQH